MGGFRAYRVYPSWVLIGKGYSPADFLQAAIIFFRTLFNTHSATAVASLDYTFQVLI